MVAVLNPSNQAPSPPTLASQNATERNRAERLSDEGSRLPQASINNSASSQSVADRRPASVEDALDVRGSVTFRKTPLSEVVFLLSDLWQINIVAGDAVTGEVSGSFHDAPLREVLSAVLTSSGYSYRKTGSSLVVLTADQVGTDDPSFVSETMTIPAMLREDDSAVAAAQMLLSDRGQIRRLGSDLILVIDSDARIQRVRALFASFGPSTSPNAHGSNSTFAAQLADNSSNQAGPTPATSSLGIRRSAIAYFSPQFVEAEDMQESLQMALGDQVIVAVFPAENRIMVKGSAADLQLATEAIDQLDRPRSQVRITATIYDVSLSEVERLGINWSVQPHSRGTGLLDINDADSLQFRNLIGATTGLITDTSAPGAANFAVTSLNNTVNVDTLLQALQGNSEAKLLADPSVTVGDRREASIRIVQRIPIIAADPVENSGVVFSQVQFEDAGVTLNVRPRISRDSTIEMQVKPEYSVVTDFIQNNPVIDSRTAETTVRVGNGQTFVLGGLRQKSVVESTRGVPLLKDVKYIGKLFRSHDTEIVESELIVFIRPEIITPYDCGNARQREAARVSNQQLDRIPHAQDYSMIPCCGDKYCPNHHPTIKANAGSEGLRFSDCGTIQDPGHAVFEPSETRVPLHEPNQVYEPNQEILEHPHRETVIEPYFPPVHTE
jgi:general secretion pathway protein D